MTTYPPTKMEQTECRETSAYKIQTPVNCPEESIQHISYLRKVYILRKFERRTGTSPGEVIEIYRYTID